MADIKYIDLDELEIGAISMSPGQICWQWDGERMRRRPDLDGLTLVDAIRASARPAD